MQNVVCFHRYHVGNCNCVQISRNTLQKAKYLRRYPEIIDNESSLEWYNEKHLELRKLEEEIENACCELDKKFFLDSGD